MISMVEMSVRLGMVERLVACAQPPAAQGAPRSATEGSG
jgi:hypothetical protein